MTNDFKNQLFAKYPVLKEVLESETTPAYCEDGWSLRGDDIDLDFFHHKESGGKEWFDGIEEKFTYYQKTQLGNADEDALDAFPHFKSALIEALAEIEAKEKEIKDLRLLIKVRHDLQYDKNAHMTSTLVAIEQTLTDRLKIEEDQ